jgi:hypothetical protein
MSKFVLAADRLARELAQLADRHEARVQAVGERRADDEAAPFHTGEFPDPARRITRREQIDHRVKATSVREQGGEVVVGVAATGKVGDFTDQRTNVHCGQGSFHERDLARRKQ